MVWCCPCFDHKGAEYVALSPQRGGGLDGERLNRSHGSGGAGDSTVLPGVSLPVWVPDEAVEKCYGCSAAFDFVNRKHHCRRCRNIFCHNCTPQEAERPLRMIGAADPVRLCRACSKAVPEENDFIQHFLPVLVRGGAFYITRGITFSKVAVQMGLSRSGMAVEFGEPGARERTAIFLPDIQQVSEDGNGLGMRVVTRDKTYAFTCMDHVQRYDWVKALRGASRTLPSLVELKLRVEQEREQRLLQEQMALADKARKEKSQQRRQSNAQMRAELAKKYGLSNR